MTVLIQFLAVFCSGTFFGAAVYISIAQHPATMLAGMPFAAKFFPPMYRHAAPMQICLAVVGTAAGLVQWYMSGDVLWLVGGLCLLFVIPFTVLVLKPINDVLLGQSTEADDAATEALLNKWAPRHWVRSITSGASFALYLLAIIGQ